MRDAITLFEQYAIGEELTYDMIAKNLQLVGDVFLENFLHALIARDVPQVLKDLDYLKEQ
jgi:DNA polymerase III gamma/tau subunit